MAIEGKYNPKGYGLEDMGDTFLALKLGSSKLLYAQNKSRGLASKTALARSDIFKIPRFVMESGSLILRGRMRAIVITNFERQVWSSPVEERCLWALMIDDVNATKRARPDSHESSVGGIPALGLCRCQSCWRTVDTNIKTHDDLIALRSIVDTAPCGGLADEITVITIAPNHERDYAPKYLFASGTCKQGNQSRDSAVMLETIFEVWNSDPRGYEQRGPCPVVWSDGGGGILKGAHSVLAKEILPMQHPLHGPLAQMLLFNKHLKVYGKTATSDGSEQKHNFKRSKEAVKSEKREWRTHGPSSFTFTGAFLRDRISNLYVTSPDGVATRAWTPAEVTTMFKSGFADAQNVPACVLLLRAIKSLGGRNVRDFPAFAASQAKTMMFNGAKPTLNVIAR